jgi:antirestriction protein ArdC
MNVYQVITDKIVASLEAGVKPWVPNWDAGSTGNQFPLRACGTPYRGINVWLLWATQAQHGYTSNYWLTYKKAQEIGGQVRKGEKASTAVFASSFDKKEANAGPDDKAKRIAFLKAYSVFNADQVDGLPDSFRAKPAIARPAIELIAEAEAFFAATGARISHGGNRAFYRPSTDEIVLPNPDAFHDAAGYASVKAHELVHWTGHASRLDRPFNHKTGDDGYAREELVAELGSAYLCGILGISNEPRDDHAAYLAAWIKTMKSDSRAIVQAASKAQAACDYLQSIVAMPVAIAA